MSDRTVPRAFVPRIPPLTGRRSVAGEARRTRRATALGLLALSAGLAGCAGRQQVGGPTRAPSGPLPETFGSDPVAIYRTMGLVAAGGQMPFVARVAFLPDEAADSTLALVALSLAPRAIGFSREDDQYAGSYTVRVEIRQGPTLVRTIETTETVRVATFRETSRSDDAIVFQQFLRLAPGRYALSVNIRDAFRVRGSAAEASLEVPRLTQGTLASPIPVLQAVPRTTPDSLPRVLVRPSATVVFGRDSLLPVYLEVAGTRAPTRIRLIVRGEESTELWRDSTVLLGRGGNLVSGLVGVPVADLGIGVVTLEAMLADAPADSTGAPLPTARRDTARTAILVSLGDELPVADFDELIGYLKWFATAERLRDLRESKGAARATAWREFLTATDPFPNTPEHEALRDYFQRIRIANERFRDDGPIGWLSDRGTAYVGLGEPDNIYDSQLTDPTRSQRQQVWEYRRWRLQLVFLDQSGYGRWRLPTGGMAELQSTIRRKLLEEQR